MNYICKTLNIYSYFTNTASLQLALKDSKSIHVCVIVVLHLTLLFSVCLVRQRGPGQSTQLLRRLAQPVLTEIRCPCPGSVLKFILCLSHLPSVPSALTSARAAGGHVTALDLGIQVDANMLVSTQRACSVARKVKKERKAAFCPVRLKTRPTESRSKRSRAARRPIRSL